MLVFISNLQLNDGTLGAAIPPQAMELFLTKLRELAFAASHRADGVYRPIEVIDLVLLGDTMDFIGSAHWLSTNARPWHDPHSPESMAAFEQIGSAVLEGNESTLQLFRELAAGESIRLPRDERRSIDLENVQERPLAARIHYMAGDRDWPLHLPDEAASQLRRRIAQSFGLVNRIDLPFAHDCAEDDLLLEALRRHGVVARHGDIYDPIHFDASRDSSSLADLLSIELFARFETEMHRHNSELDAVTRSGLAATRDVRPMLAAPRWIDAVLNRTCESAELREQVRSTWDRLVDALLDSPDVRSRESWGPVDLVDALAVALKFRRSIRGRSRHTSAAVIHDWLSADNCGQSFYPNALAEADAHSAKHIVNGHSQWPETLPLNSDAAHYFSTGSWRRVITPRGISHGDTISLVAIYKQDERGGQPFETWTGRFGDHESGRRLAA